MERGGAIHSRHIPQERKTQLSTVLVNNSHVNLITWLPLKDLWWLTHNYLTFPLSPQITFLLYIKVYMLLIRACMGELAIFIPCMWISFLSTSRSCITHKTGHWHATALWPFQMAYLIMLHSYFMKGVVSMGECHLVWCLYREALLQKSWMLHSYPSSHFIWNGRISHVSTSL